MRLRRLRLGRRRAMGGIPTQRMAFPRRVGEREQHPGSEAGLSWGKSRHYRRLRMPSEPLSIFFSYSHKDQDLMQDLVGHLEPLRRGQLIHSWHDGCISPGEEWEPQIKENLEKAHIILLLVSVDFINSDYCYTVELSRAIARHKAGDACVIPVILRSCLWKQVPVGDMRLGDLQALPKDAKPIRQWADLDAAYTSIAEGLYDKIQQLRQAQAQADYAASLVHYRQTFVEAVKAGYPLSQSVLDQLKALQQQLGLQDDDIDRIEHPILKPAEASYRAALAEAERQRKRDEHYNGGLDHLDQGNYDQAIADFTQAEQLGHPQASEQVAEAEREREEAERQLKRYEYYDSGCDYFDQGNYDQAIADFTQAEQLGHPWAAKLLAEAKRQKQANQDDLRSEKGIDYTRLRDLLKPQDWRAADQETYEAMIRAVGKKSGDWFTQDELLNFPCADLLTIDRLWVKYSQGKFGFSVQKKIYVECGAQLDGQYPGDRIWHEFCDHVGWRKGGNFLTNYSNLEANPSVSPAGEFPYLPLLSGNPALRVWLGSRLYRFSGFLLSHRDF